MSVPTTGARAPSNITTRTCGVCGRRVTGDESAFAGWCITASTNGVSTSAACASCHANQPKPKPDEVVLITMDTEEMT